MSTPLSRRTVLAGSLVLATWCPMAWAQAVPRKSLAYDAKTAGPVPIPPSGRDLQTVTADPWFAVPGDKPILEGAAFDGAGDLLFCNVSARLVLRLTSERRLSVVTSLEKLSPGGLALHRDGRIFIAAMDLSNGTGAISAVNPDGSGLRTIIPVEAGFMPNDIVFDRQGGFYFTDFKGSSTDPKGGVFYVTPDFTGTTPVLPHLAMANGVALSPDGHDLWVTEFSRNALYRVELATATTATPIGTAIAYQFTGPAPDSMRADADGNLYVALFSQGRVLVLNRNGIPIGQILLPGRNEGHNLTVTSMALHPGTRDLYIVAADTTDRHSAAVFRAQVFAKAILP